MRTLFNSDYQLVNEYKVKNIVIRLYELKKGQKIYGGWHSNDRFIPKGHKCIVWGSENYTFPELYAESFIAPTKAEKRLAEMIRLIESSEINFMAA